MALRDRMTCNLIPAGPSKGDTRCSTSISSICLISKFVQADPQTRVLLELGRFLRIAGNKCLHSSSFFNHPSETRSSFGRRSGVDRTDQRQATSSLNAKLRRFEGLVPQSSLSTCIGSHHRKKSPEPRFLLCPGPGFTEARVWENQGPKVSTQWLVSVPGQGRRPDNRAAVECAP